MSGHFACEQPLAVQDSQYDFPRSPTQDRTSLPFGCLFHSLQRGAANESEFIAGNNRKTAASSEYFIASMLKRISDRLKAGSNSDGTRHGPRNKIARTQIILLFLTRGKTANRYTATLCRRRDSIFGCAAQISPLRSHFPPLVSTQINCSGGRPMDTARSLNTLAAFAVFIFLGAVLLGMF